MQFEAYIYIKPLDILNHSCLLAIVCDELDAWIGTI